MGTDGEDDQLGEEEVSSNSSQTEKTAAPGKNANEVFDSRL